ncbi:MAG TPA: c-type cytochrome biogenesis protein CcmI [Xanthobacteraceae bacterium]|jgi:cytochrome c-type biogenesis protein CcmH|nr:c-type cytochrome biogenesis protein CcmI [Xanthobacteraceae bacterium]
MVLWIIFAVMTAAAVCAVLWPLGRKPSAGAGSDRLVYADQLQEIDRDRAAGLIGEAEAESARVEISRRLLAAADAEARLADIPAAQPRWHRRMAVVTAVVVVPLVALGLYLKLGSPDVPDQPALARVTAPPDRQSVAGLVSQVEAHLAQNPNDGAGWEVLAPVYLRMGRFDDAVMAWRKAIALNGDSPVREADLGEALVAAANGVVTDEAKTVFQKAVAGDPHEPKAGYFLGLADEQDGNRDAAAAKWRALLDSAPPGAPWADFVRAALARVTGQASAVPAPAPGDVAAADAMTPTQRTEMIRGMVQRLSDRLQGDGHDVEGWLRLVRAYVVLGDRDKANDAATDAKRALADRPDDVKRIDDLVKDLGLAG